MAWGLSSVSWEGLGGTQGVVGNANQSWKPEAEEDGEVRPLSQREEGRKLPSRTVF
jgi:hypothetical protein